MALLYMWGHSHFLDNSGWDRMTTICETLGNRDDIWYAKNIEVADYLRAINNLVYTDSIVYNPSPDIAIWLKTESGFEVLNPHVTAIDNSFLDNHSESTFLKQNYPNPANVSTTIPFKVVESSVIDLSVYNLQGRQIRTILNEKMNAGEYQKKLDTSNLTEGVYIYTLKSNTSQTSRLLSIVH